jgi:hypothetical protein
VEAMRLLIDHPSADAAAMMMLTANNGSNALMAAAQEGRVEAMRLLIDHPSADAAGMMMHADSDGYTALAYAAQEGHAAAMRLLIDHPSADAAAMIMHADSYGSTALSIAAGFAAGQPTVSPRAPPTRSCAPLLLLLRRVPVESQPNDAQQAHVSKVMEVLHGGPRSNVMFGSDQPDDVRDECIHLLLERGASYPLTRSPVVSRIIKEYVQLARVPQLVNEAIVGVAFMLKQQKLEPQDDE